MILLGAVGVGRRQRNRDFEFDPDGITALNRGTRNSDELNQWRRIGLNEQEIAQLNDPNISRADREALIARSNAVYRQLYGQVGAEGLSTLNQRLGVDGVQIVYQAGGNDGLQTVIDVIGLENQGSIRNFDDWASFFSEGNRANNNVQDLLSELQEAKRVSTTLREGEVVDIGGDARAEVNARGERQKTFDMKVENVQTGQTVRNIEVKTLRDAVEDYTDLTEGIRHAIDKRIDATGGTVEATIQMELATEVDLPGDKTKVIDPSGNYSIIEADDFSSYNTGNIFQDVKNNLPQIELGNRPRINDNQNVNLIDRVNIVRKDGSLFATYYKENSQWKLEM